MTILIIISYFFPPEKRLKEDSSIQIDSKNEKNIKFTTIADLVIKHENGTNKRVMTIYIDNFFESSNTWKIIFDYANKRPLTYGGYTALFFFNNLEYTPKPVQFTEYFDRIYNDYCVAGYWKYSNGTDIFRQYPFRKYSNPY